MLFAKVEETSKPVINSDSNVADGGNISQLKAVSTLQTDKGSSNEGGESKRGDNRLYFSRNFKVGRGKQTNSANQGEKEGPRAPSINKELLVSHIKATQE